MKTQKGPKLIIIGVDCACTVEGYHTPDIVMCPLHESAPDLLETCKRALHDLGGDNPKDGFYKNTSYLRNVIKKAEGL